MSFSPSNTYGNYLPENIVISRNEGIEYFLKDVLENYARFINRKDTGSYDLIEQVINQQYYGSNPQTKRNVFRKVFNIGAIAIGATSNTVHGITSQTSFTRIYGTAVTDVIDYRPIPYVSATSATAGIELKIDATNIIIINGAASQNITSANIVVEYLKN